MIRLRDDVPDPDGFDDDFDLDEEFPLGDGTAATEGTVRCPYCGEENEIGLDPGSGPTQDYVEDCGVCCQPWRVHVEYGADGSAIVSVSALDD
jgi:hypothetical protein